MTKRESIYKQLLEAHGVVSCYVCARPVAWKHATLEHIIPRSRGGSGNRRNLAISHAACNVRKGNEVSPRDLALGFARKTRAAKKAAPQHVANPPNSQPAVAPLPERTSLFLTGDWDVCRYAQQTTPYSKDRGPHSKVSERYSESLENMAEWTGLEPATPGVTGRG